MKIFSVTIVQNQEDIIEDIIRHHQPLFDDLYIWNIGSEDATTEILKNLESEFSNIHVKNENRSFSNDLRGEYYLEIKHKYTENDWYYQLDSDEFLYTDIKRLISKTKNENIGYFRSWHFNFMYTERDKSKRIHDYKQLHYYSMNYSEIRAFKNSSLLLWPINDFSVFPLGNILPNNLTKKFKCNSQFLTIYHYPNRSLEQIRNRIDQKLKIVNGPIYHEKKNINYRKYKAIDINCFIADHNNAKDIRVNTTPSRYEKSKVLYKTIYKPLLKNYIAKIKLRIVSHLPINNAN